MANDNQTPSQVSPEATASVPPGNPQGTLDEEWLQSFYKEAGREATLAYTTLNQMKNWAMLVAAAALSGVPFGSKSSDYPTPIMFAGSVIVYTFILRFFIRAILCYINLTRWNVLQNDCVQLKLLPQTKHASTSAQEREVKLRKDLQDYYFDWLSPLSRRSQIFQNLKLGFYLLFGLSLFFLIWGAVVLRHDHLVQGLITFAFLNTALEFWDFAGAKYFDDPAAWERRAKKGKTHDIFPVPHSRGVFMGLWIVNVVLSAAVALWPAISSIISKLRCG